MVSGDERAIGNSNSWGDSPAATNFRKSAFILTGSHCPAPDRERNRHRWFCPSTAWERPVLPRRTWSPCSFADLRRFLQRLYFDLTDGSPHRSLAFLLLLVFATLFRLGLLLRRTLLFLVGFLCGCPLGFVVRLYFRLLWVHPPSTASPHDFGSTGRWHPAPPRWASALPVQNANITTSRPTTVAIDAFIAMLLSIHRGIRPLTLSAAVSGVRLKGSCQNQE